MPIKFVKCEFKTLNTAIITVEFIPPWLFRVFGAKSETCQYVGSGTVWNDYRSFRHAGTMMDSILSEFWQRAKWERDYGPPE